MLFGLTEWGAFIAVFFIGLAEGVYLIFFHTTGPKVIAGHFSVYHIFLLLLLIAVCGWYLPIGIALQDVISNSTDFIYKGQKGDPRLFGDWVKWPHTKLVWPGVPRLYWGLLFLQLSILIYFKDVLIELFK